MKLTKFKLTFAIIATLVMVVVGTKYGLGQFNQEAKTLYGIADKVKGDANAPLKIVKFFDYQCPSCARATQMIDEYFEKYPGQIYLQMKYFPLKGHAHGMVAARFAECARMQNKFWEVNDKILHTQDVWRDLADAIPTFSQISKDAELDIDVLDQCLNDEETIERIMNDKKEGQNIPLRSTPSFIVNGELVVGYKAMKAFMEERFPEE